jgi:hypothetical protein
MFRLKRICISHTYANKSVFKIIKETKRLNNRLWFLCGTLKHILLKNIIQGNAVKAKVTVLLLNGCETSTLRADQIGRAAVEMRFLQWVTQFQTKYSEKTRGKQTT